MHLNAKHFDVGDLALQEDVSAQMTRAIRDALQGAVRASGLSPMIVLELAAVAVGAVYRETAEDGETQACLGGWTPDEGVDIAALRTAVAIGAIARPASVACPWAAAAPRSGGEGRL